MHRTLENFDTKIMEIKKETTWKIPEIESMLKLRITEEKTNTLIKSLNENLILKLTQQHDKLLERVFLSFKECNTKVDTAVEFTDNRYNDTKRELLRISTLAESAVKQ